MTSAKTTTAAARFRSAERAVAVVPGFSLSEIREPRVAFLQEPSVGIDDPPVQRRAQDRLCLDTDHPQLSIIEVALLLHGRDEPLVGQVSLAEVPAQDRSGDGLSVRVDVVPERMS